MIDPKAFNSFMIGLGNAFGRKPDDDMIFEYYKALGNADLAALESSVKWFKENSEGGFPRIASLKQRVESETRPKNHEWHDRDANVIIVECPQCNGSFAVMKGQLQDDAKRGGVYRCPNYRHWRCPVVFEAASIVPG